MSHPRIAGGFLTFGMALSVLSMTGCAYSNAKCQVCQRRDTGNEPVFVALEDVAKMNKLPRGTVLTISGAMWDKWSSKMKRVDFDPKPGQVRFMMHRLPGGDEDRLGMLEFCPDDAPSCPWVVNKFPDGFLAEVRRENERRQEPCRIEVSFLSLLPRCRGTCDLSTSCSLVQSTFDLPRIGPTTVFWCECGN